MMTETTKEIKPDGTYIPYQLCPVCNGTGKIQSEMINGMMTTAPFESCPTCAGTRIIPMLFIAPTAKPAPITDEQIEEEAEKRFPTEIKYNEQEKFIQGAKWAIQRMEEGTK